MANEDLDPEFVAALREDMNKRALAFAAKHGRRTALDHSNVGRIAHLHTLVEHELLALISTIAPRLGDIGEVGLSFAQLRKIGVEAARFEGDTSFPANELQVLNELRNSFAGRFFLTPRAPVQASEK